MGLNTNERQDVVYFTGYEVEHTICHGKLTLFVVGTPPLDEILAKVADTGADHVYFDRAHPKYRTGIWRSQHRTCLMVL